MPVDVQCLVAVCAYMTDAMQRCVALTNAA